MIIVLAFVALGIISYFGYRDYLSRLVPANAPSTVSGLTTYIGVGNEGEYTLINTTTGEVKDFIPSGYELLGYNYAYQVFPDFLLLKKGSKLYSYNVANREIKEIKNITIKTTETVTITSSISEEHKFYILVFDTRPNPDNLKFGEDIIGERGYFYDAISNQISGADKVINDFSNETLYDIFEYDSKNSRFFINPNHEPIVSALPLLVYDIKTGEKKDVVSLKDFRIDEKEKFGGRVFYSNGCFIAMSDTHFSKITLVEPTANPSKTDLTLSEGNFKKLDIYSTYSGLYVKEKNIIFLGYADKIALLRFNKSNKLISIKFLYHPESIYINNPYSDGNNIYYKGDGDEITVVDLKSLEFKKKIPSRYYQTITLFR